MDKKKKIKVKGTKSQYSLAPKKKGNKTHNKVITKQNKVVVIPPGVKPNSISHLLWKAQRQTIQVKKTKFTHDEIFMTGI